MEIEALRELSEEELIDRLGEVRQFMRDLTEENKTYSACFIWSLIFWKVHKPNYFNNK